MAYFPSISESIMRSDCPLGGSVAKLPKVAEPIIIKALDMSRLPILVIRRDWSTPE